MRNYELLKKGPAPWSWLHLNYLNEREGIIWKTRS